VHEAEETHFQETLTLRQQMEQFLGRLDGSEATVKELQGQISTMQHEASVRVSHATVRESAKKTQPVR